VLLEGVPQGLALEDINSELLRIPGVKEVHDLHVWSITTGKNTLTAHLVCDSGAGEPEQSVLKEAQGVLGKRFGVTHSTIQIEATRCAPATIAAWHGRLTSRSTRIRVTGPTLSGASQTPMRARGRSTSARMQPSSKMSQHV
jgi:hypothetical protein